jgi:hypothetical protein
MAVLGLAGGIIAKKKGRSFTIWFVLCALFPLLIAVVALSPSKAIKEYTKKCFYCSRFIKEDVRYCEYCGKEQPIEMVKVSSDKYDSA